MLKPELVVDVEGLLFAPEGLDRYDCEVADCLLCVPVGMDLVLFGV